MKSAYTLAGGKTVATTFLVVHSNERIRNSIVKAISEIDASADVIAVDSAKAGAAYARNRNVLNGILVEARIKGGDILVKQVRRRDKDIPLVVVYQENDREALTPFAGIHYEPSLPDLAATSIMRILGAA